MDEIPALRALAEALAARLDGWHPDITPDLPPPQFLPATVLDDLPAPLPLLDNATIIGTVRHSAPVPGPVQALLILFDTRRAFAVFEGAGCGRLPGHLPGLRGGQRCRTRPTGLRQRRVARRCRRRSVRTADRPWI